MKKYLLLIIIASFSFCKVTTAQVLCIYCYDQNDTISANMNNLILNGGFENSNCPPYPPIVTFCPNSTSHPLCNISNWTCTGGGNSTYAFLAGPNSGISTIAEGNRVAYFGNSGTFICSPLFGDTTCIIDIDCTVGGMPAGYPINTDTTNYGATGVSLEQPVNGLVSGSTYVLEFWAGGEASSSFFINRGLFAIDIGFGDTLLSDNPTPFSGGIGTRYIIEFNAISSSHTIKFTNWGHICYDCTELVLDDVRLYTLAELDASVPHCTVGIDNPDFQNAEYLISPNPVINELNIKTNSNELSEIIFYDMASRKLLQQTFFNTTTINTSQLSKGIYLYELRNKEGVVKKGKVVKE